MNVAIVGLRKGRRRQDNIRDQSGRHSGKQGRQRTGRPVLDTDTARQSRNSGTKSVSVMATGCHRLKC